MELLAKNVVGGAGFFSNLQQRSDLGYFDPPVRTNPLLHLWSLGIEEQFYIVWPVLLVWLWKRGERVLMGILLIAGASFALNIALLPREPVRTFYNPLTRTWELMAGAALARFTLLHGEIKRRANREFMSAAGVALSAAGLVLLNERKPFPGWWTLLPVCGAVLLVSAGSEAWFNRWVLAARPFVAIGLISYPLYLWHWPLLVFLRLVLQSDFQLTPRRHMAAVATVLMLAVALSWVTYRFWETPMRFSTRLTSVFRVRLLLAGMAGIAVLGVLGPRTIPPRLNSTFVKELERAKADFVYTGNWKTAAFKTVEIRALSTHSTLLVGDSHMEQYVPRAEAAIQADPHLASAVFATHGGCPPLPGMNVGEPGFHCPAFYDYWTALARDARFSTVAISTFWQTYLPAFTWRAFPLTFHGRRATARDYEEAWQGLARDLRTLVSEGKRVVIFASSPASPLLDPESGLRRLHSPGLWRSSPVSRASLEESLEPVTQRLNEVARYSGAEIISPRDYLCHGGECPAVDTDGSPIYKDGSHIRASKAAKLAIFVDDVLRPGGTQP